MCLCLALPQGINRRHREATERDTGAATEELLRPRSRRLPFELPGCLSDGVEGPSLWQLDLRL